MAELGIKIKVDGVETVLKSFNDVEARVNSLKKQIASADIGSDKQKQLQKDLKATEAAYTSAQIKNQSFLDTIAKAPGIMGTLGQSIKGVNQGFQALAANPYTAALGLFIGIITKVIEKMSSMEVITDALGKVMGAFGAIVGNIVSAVVTPLAEGIAYLIDGMTSLMSAFSDSAADGAEFADALDNATEAEKENAIAVAEANAQLAEARERAADATLATKDRVKALQDAAAIEKKVTEDSIKINTQKLAAQLGTIATEMGARKELIDQIKSGSLEEIKAARASLLAMKNVDKDKVYALDQMIIAIENDQKKSANIQRKTAKEIKAIEDGARKEQEAAAKDAETKRLERIKKANEARIKELDASIANEIAREDTRDKELRTLLDARMKFDLEGVKKGSELEAKIRREYAEKATQALDTDFKKRSADTLKALAEENQAVAKAGEKQLITNQEIRDKEFNEIQLALSKQEITEDEARKRTFEAAKKQGEADLQLLKDNKQKEIDALEAVKDKLTGEEYLKQKEAITEKYESKITNQTKTNNKLVLDNTLATNKEISASNKQLQEDRVALLDLEFEDLNTSLDRRIAILKEKEAIMLANTSLSEDARTAIRKKTAADIIATEIAEKEASTAITMAKLDLAVQAGQFLQQIAGKNKAIQIAGLVIEKAASIGQIVASTALANAKAVAAFPVTFGQPWVTINTISAGLSIATTIAAAAKAIGEINSQSTEKAGGSAPSAKSTPTGSKFAQGGLLSGPSHAQGGVKTSFGELEGGEYVINRRSTASFLPLLTAINSAGNRKYQDGGMAANMDTIQAMMASQPQPVIKTYVVASDMTSQQEANKKIADLARL
jgi:hypothetical protein